ncbi:hypothetical protein BgiMline_031745, partial [Biomphalaria glabrata]
MKYTRAISDWIELKNRCMTSVRIGLREDEVTGDEVTGDEVTGNEVTGDEVTGDEVTGDEVTGDEVTGNLNYILPM